MGWITAEQALQRPGTKPQTLYANVSRGRIAAKPDATDPRRSLYSTEDIDRLASRQHGRRRAETVAAQSIAWGDPVLPTTISTVQDGRLYYRGEDAAVLSRTADLEAVAGLLWGGKRPRFPIMPGEETAGLAQAFTVLGRLAASDMPTLGRGSAVLHADAARVMGAVSRALAGSTATELTAHERLARHWHRPEAADIIRRALVLLAEHELNTSTFCARITVSTGAPLSAAVLSGLCTLSGPLHGGAAAAMDELVDAAERLGPEQAVHLSLRQGRALPCFGHRLYPHGDVRAAELLAHFEAPPLYRDLATIGEALVGEKPNIDFALSAMAAAFSLPPAAPLILFTLARSVGWLAHALEQIETGSLIRPRARYVGPPPAY
jgi:citrate synthase